MRPRSATPLKAAALADFAARQHGVVTRRQLLASGFTSAAISRALRQRRLIALYRGVYAVGHAQLTLSGHQLAAVFACGPGAVLSHRSAAGAWGLLPTPSGRVEVTAPGRSSRPRHPRINLHRTRSLPPDEVTALARVPITSVARTLLDLAEVITPLRLSRAAEAAVKAQRFDLSAVQAVMAAHPGRHGAPALRRILDDLADDPPLTRSELERLMRELCATHALPMPASNATVLGEEVDFYWRERGVALETDGWWDHRTRAAFERDRLKDLRLRAAGIEVVRCTHRHLTRRPGEIVGLLRAVLG
jgi:hypothetical protein